MISYKLPELSYDLGALEPVISGQIMEIHYLKHHQTYITNLNLALEKYGEAEKRGDLAAQIALQPALRFNGGGHLNHSLFWTYLTPPSRGGGVPPDGELAKALDLEFGSLSSFIEAFTQATVAIQGSGWGWLGYDPAKKRLLITTCQNQDPLSGLLPILGIDVWEHAYYLQYKNMRGEYLKRIWEVINWRHIEEKFRGIIFQK